MSSQSHDGVGRRFKRQTSESGVAQGQDGEDAIWLKRGGRLLDNITRGIYGMRLTNGQTDKHKEITIRSDQAWKSGRVRKREWGQDRR